MKRLFETAPDAIRITVPSRRDCIRPVHAFVHELAAHGGLDEERAHDFALAVEEALVNAIEHGNGSDSTKRVEVEIGWDRQEISVRVTDQGGGFRIEDVPDPTAPENLERASGRGILFMRAFADDVGFEAKPGRGTTVILRKRFGKTGAGAPDAPRAAATPPAAKAGTESSVTAKKRSRKK